MSTSTAQDTPTYLDSHAWLTFDLDLQACLPRFWMLLGEARSKCEHIKYVPLRTDTARMLMNVYFARGVNATTAIEGNTLSEEQVRERMEGQLELPISQEYLGVEIDNMLKAYNGLSHRIQDGEHISIDGVLLKDLNRQILDGLEVNPGVTPGEFRTHSVAVGPYLAPRAEEVDQLVRRLCQWLESLDVPAEGDMRVPMAIIKAIVAHVYVEWIHPFGDGNGRLGRLVEFLVLMSSGLPQPAVHVLTSHYNDTRTEYYRQLNAASRTNDIKPFLLYAAQGLVDGLTKTIKQLHQQQELLMWQALVDDAFHEHRATESTNRQRMLAIELAKQFSDDWVPRAAARHLTPELTEMYAGKTPKTITRDVNRLATMGLVARDFNGRSIRAVLESVRGMRPFALDPVE